MDRMRDLDGEKEKGMRREIKKGRVFSLGSVKGRACSDTDGL